MALRQIIEIDEKKCTGCGLCIPNCPEGALQIIDEKARLVSDLFCDGLGACIGHCPEGAIHVTEREAEPYDEEKVMANVVKQGRNTIIAHLKHLKEHGADEYLRQALRYLEENGIEVTVHELQQEKESACNGGCPGSKVVEMDTSEDEKTSAGMPTVSRLRQWPVQIKLVPPAAPFFKGADVLLAADCVPFAFAGFHEELLKGKVLLVGCPKLDDADFYLDKLRNIFSENEINSVTVARMEVPCCSGLTTLTRKALEQAGCEVSFEEVVLSIKGGKIE